MTRIGVSSMTNCESFLKDGVPFACAKLAELGYRQVELSQHIQVNEETIPQFEAAMGEHGLGYCAFSTGFNGNFPGRPFNPFPELKSYSLVDDFEELVALCQRLDCHILRFASIPGRKLYTMEQVEGYMRATEEMCLRLAERGISLCVHNHAEEFAVLNGKTVFDWSLELAPHLCWEIDTLNAQRCGVNPVSLIQRCGPRAILLHLQDFRIKPACEGEAPVGREDVYEFAEVGEGLMDIPAIVNAAVAAGTRCIVVEQARFYGRDPYESLALSAKNLRAMGYGDLF